MALKPAQEQPKYFAFARGRLETATTDFTEAVRAADEHMGVVVDERQKYLWKRARKSIQTPLEVQPSDAVLDMWSTTESKQDQKQTDSYSMYVKIMKSVAEIMNESHE